MPVYQHPQRLRRTAPSLSARTATEAREQAFVPMDWGNPSPRFGHSFSRLSVMPPEIVSRQAEDVGDDSLGGAQAAEGSEVPTGFDALGAGQDALGGSNALAVAGIDPNAVVGAGAVGAGAGVVGAGAVGAAPSCAVNAECGPSFCSPMSLPKFAVQQLMSNSAPVLLAGIAAAVSPRVVPLWSQYLFGGASPQDLSGQFGADFTQSRTTERTTDFLFGELVKSIVSNPPVFPAGSNVVTLNVVDLIGPAIAQIDDPSSLTQMDFNVIGEVPGNIAGGIGKDEASCPVGAKPSPFNDSRGAAGTVTITRNPDNTLSIVSGLLFTVQDTVDLCPGNCGASKEQIATIPMSQFEASGVSGDVPFTVNFPAPARQATTPPVSPTPQPVPPQPVPPSPTPSGIFQSKRFSGDPILEACAQGTHRMTFGEPASDAVAKVQQTLIDAGFPLPISTQNGTPDGVFGQETGDAVAQFKRDHHLSPSDPVVGPQTVHALDDFAAGEGQ